MNMVEEHYHPMNHWREEEGMNIVDEHYHLMNHQLEVEDMDMVGTDMTEECSSNHRSEVEDMDREDMTVEANVVEREHQSVVLVRHWTDDGVERHWRGHREWEELVKSECSEDHTTFISRNSNCST
jgi:hypothetical protein